MIRDTAVNQLADWQKQHPDELFNLLARVVPYLRHKEWETRSTAAKAIGKIIENAPPHDPNADEEASEPKVEDVKNEEVEAGDEAAKKEEEPDATVAEHEVFKLDSLDIDSILKYGRELLRGGAVEYGLAALDPQARLEHQKKTLVGRLGLLGRKYEDEEIPVVNDNLATPATPLEPNGSGLPRSDSMSQPHEESHMSARQLNVLKRKHP